MSCAVGVGCGITFGDVASSIWTPFDADLVWLISAEDAAINAGTMTIVDATGNNYTPSGASYPTIDIFPGTTDVPALLFNGTSHHLDGSVIALPATVGEIYTLVYVAQYADGGNRFLFDLNTNAGINGVAIDQGLDGVGPSLRKKGVTSDGTSVAKVGVPIYVEHEFRVAAAHSSITRINGVVTATAAPAAQIAAPTGTGFGLGWFSSGSAFHFKGYYGIGFLVHGALTSPQRSDMAGYMASKWKIT